MPFISGFSLDHEAEHKAYWFAFKEGRLLICPQRITDAVLPVPYAQRIEDLGLIAAHRQYLGQLDDTPCYAARLHRDTDAPDGTAFTGIRELFGRIDDTFIVLAGRAGQIVRWDETHCYCGRCGTPMSYKTDERAKECPSCGLLSYPRISPAMIVAVVRNGRILLARAARFPTAFYSVLAGFVEPGETLEEAVKREVLEEVGIEVENIRYFGSQPWPFPDSLMIGFTACYAGGSLSTDDKEILDAGWYAPDNLPQVPGKFSIAGRLIEWFVETHTQDLQPISGRTS